MGVSEEDEIVEMVWIAFVQGKSTEIVELVTKYIMHGIGRYEAYQMAFKELSLISDNKDI